MQQSTAWLFLTLLASFGVFLVVAGGYAPAIPPSLLAQVSTSVGVSPNPYNTLNEQLNQERASLNQEAADLAAREAALASSTDASSGATRTAASSISPEDLFAAIIMVALLLMLNFYLDWHRERREHMLSQPQEPPQNQNGGPQ